MAFTEFYMQSGGSNLNSGSTNNNSSTYSSAGGNWVNSTRVFTPTDGQTTSSLVNVGDFASVYVTAGATATGFIGRVTAVGAGANGTVTIFSAAIYGTVPANGTGTITVKVGGAWSGPGGAVSFPFLSGSMSLLVNTNGDQVRLNVKNNQTYSMTSALAMTGLGKTVMQGYASSVGDLGKAIFTSNVTSGDNFTISGVTPPIFIDLIFASTAGSGTVNLLVVTTSPGITCIRTVFHGARASGFASNSGQSLLYECEAYDCNKANNAGSAGFLNFGSGAMICANVYSHDHTSGSNGDAFGIGTVNGASIILINSMADSAGGNGLSVGSAAINGSVFAILNSNFYNMTGDAIKFSNSASSGFAIIANNNFLKNGGKAINNTVTGQSGILYNNGRGSGTQANGSGDTLASILDTSTDITYASNVTPWNAPTTGDFSTILASAIGTGRGVFTETDGTNTGTIGYPDIGSAQANAITQSPAWAGGDFILPTGYISHAYLYEWAFSSNTSFTLLSGSLPTGLTLATLSTTTAEIVGTPTVVGTFNFVLRATVGTSTGDATFHITINADPDEGIGGLLGGLRPTC